MSKDCSNIQKSLKWCEGTPSLPGIRRRLYYIAKSLILAWPKLPVDERGRVTGVKYVGDFTLEADAKWHCIDVLPASSQLTSEAQGELPSQTQLNKLTAFHPGVGEEATAASAYLNNSDNVFLVETMAGDFRVVGSDLYTGKTTVAQDLGQGPTGTAGTTISAEASDVVASPFYAGKIEAEDGDFMADGSPLSEAADVRGDE